SAHAVPRPEPILTQEIQWDQEIHGQPHGPGTQVNGSLGVAYNPNDCVELRWGALAKSDEASTCKRYAPAAQRDCAGRNARGCHWRCLARRRGRLLDASPLARAAG